jgi:hypothetical protein
MIMREAKAPVPATTLRRSAHHGVAVRTALALVVTAFAGGLLGYALLVRMSGQQGRVHSDVMAAKPRLEFTDTLASNRRNWLTDHHCYFESGAYHVYPGSTTGSVLCVAPAGSFADFDLHVTAQEVTGPLNYPYGLAFRRSSAGNFYVFVVDGDGLAWFGRYAGGHYEQLSPYWVTPTFPHGLDTACTLRVVASASHFTFFVQGRQVGVATDSRYADGMVGVFSGYSQVDAAFTNFSISDAA